MYARTTSFYESVISRLQQFDGLAPLLMRLILAPVMIIAGYSKLNIGNADLPWTQRLLADPNIVSWFGNSDWGLGLPFADFLAFAAGWTEFAGGWLLLVGLFTRLIAIPLLFTMVVAATTVHWHNGWFAITPTNPQTSPAMVLDWVGIEGGRESLSNSIMAKHRLDTIKEIVDEHGRTSYLYEKGPIVILNNGIEFAAIYFTMLLSLLFVGGGRYVSLDYYLTPRRRDF
ncbi:DoxX family protein [Pseudoalteromonas sp. SSDWG2]|uniref:HvfX family Cu-binding RiPP maturation protein n=1 Tax=Pseudoalteromonas sp. SSDWG2 TaxID=3139391 RepID=UPI003BAC568D